MSNIEWTDQTWNPVIGCTPVSPGCLNCYAATMANRMQHNPKAPEYAPRARVDEKPHGSHPSDKRLDGVWCRCGGEVWYSNLFKRGKANREMAWEAYCIECSSCDCNGYSSEKKLLKESPAFWGEHKTIRIAEVRNGRAVFTGDVRCLEDRLTDPLHWKKPRMVFVNSMSDLFHESVPFEFVDKVMAIAALCPQHTFQILTKRPERMREYFADAGRSDRVGDQLNRLSDAADREGVTHEHPGWFFNGPSMLPLPNVWLGTSVENQQCADERIPHLLATPAAVRFLSCEPLLGKVDMKLGTKAMDLRTRAPYIKWVITGGESGGQSRPCHVEWIRSIVQQCQDASVPVFVKQLGASVVSHDADAIAMKWKFVARIDSATGLAAWNLRSMKGSEMSEWPEDLRVREMPGVAHEHVEHRGWAVMFWARGHYSGYYKYATEGEARVDADERTRRFGVLGCHYKVKPVYRLLYATVGGAA